MKKDLYWAPQLNFPRQNSWYQHAFFILLLPFFVHRGQRNAAAFPFHFDVLLENSSIQGDEIALQDGQPLLESQGGESAGGWLHGQSVLLSHQHGQTFLELTHI